MSRGNQRSRTRRLVRWGLPLALLVLVAGLIAFLAAPRRVTRIVLVDQARAWLSGEAPARREIVWRPAEKLDVPETTAGQSLIRPQLAEGGTILYFTLRDERGAADIYRARRTSNGWGSAEQVEVLNSPADDIGPALSADGKTLYLYSNREGGLGGFDLYVSRREASGWTTPENLGPQVNTFAHEYSPAIAPDGRRLYFSSNRTAQMHARTKTKTADDPPEWTATLRARQGEAQFDMYASERAGGRWRPAIALADVNLPASNEGEPFVSADGAFLYLASDRPARDGEAPNYDLYRVRIDGDRLVALENLGRGVNSPANELEPSLSPEGFTLLFSSDRKQAEGGADESELRPHEDDLYSLYSSTAGEVYEESAWTPSTLPAIPTEFWWWLLLAALILGLLAALIWYLRQVSLRRLPLPAFFLIALLLHLLFAGGLFFVGLGSELAERVKQKFEEVVLSDQAPTNDAQSAPQPHEKVADLDSPAETAAPEVARQAAEATSAALPDTSDLIEIPLEAARSLPPEEVVFAPPPAPRQPPRTAPLLARKSPAAMPLDSPAIEVNSPAAAEPPAESPIPREPVQVAREESAPLPPALPEMETSVPASRPLASVEPLPDRTEAAPAPPSVADVALVRETPAADAALMSEPAIETESPPAVAETAAEAIAPAADVSVARAESEIAAGAPAAPAAEIASVPAAPATEITAPPVPFVLAPRPTSASPPAVARAAAPDISPIDPPIAPRVIPLVEDTESVDQVAIEQAEVTPAPGRVSAPVFRESAAAGAASDAGEVASAPRADSSRLHHSALGAGGAPSAAPSDRAAIGRADPAASLDAIAEEPISIASPASAASAAGDAATEEIAADIALARSDVARFGSPGQPGELDGAAPLAVPRSSDSARVDFSPGAARGAAPFAELARTPVLPAVMLYSEGEIGLEAMFRLRQGDDATKRDLIDAFGGNDQVLSAIRRGLIWLKEHQAEDGRWGLHDFDKHGPKTGGEGSVKSDVAATGLALLPFLGDGHTHLGGEHQAVVARGIGWLVENQQDSGELTKGNEGNARMYSHGIAAIALCEAYGMTRDESLKDAAQRSIDFIVASQHKGSGGWRYQPNQDGDTSVVGWQVMALKSAQMAGLDAPQKTLDGAQKWLRSVEKKGNQRGRYQYQNGRGESPPMTAEALLCREYLGAPAADESLIAGADYLLDHLPREGDESSYYWYYGTQAMFHLQGDYWRRWNGALRDLLLKTQQESGPAAGTWDPKDNWERSGGRIYSTSLRLLMLEVYYRHLPLYQVRGG